MFTSRPIRRDAPQWHGPAPYLESKNPVGPGTDGRKADHLSPRWSWGRIDNGWTDLTQPYMSLGGSQTHGGGRHGLMIRTRGEEMSLQPMWGMPDVERPKVVREDTRHIARQALVLKAPTFRTWEFRDEDAKADAKRRAGGRR